MGRGKQRIQANPIVFLWLQIGTNELIDDSWQEQTTFKIIEINASHQRHYQAAEWLANLTTTTGQHKKQKCKFLNLKHKSFVNVQSKKISNIFYKKWNPTNQSKSKPLI